MTARFFAFLIAGFLLTWALVGTPEAHSAESDTVRLTQKPTDLGVLTVIIEAPSRAWGIRKVAATVDRNVAGLDIWSRRGVSCMATVTCIRVTVANHGPFPAQTCTGRLGESWAGCAQVGGTDPYLWLNSYYPTNRGVGCHELMHALGLDHHTQSGCVGQGFTKTPSEYELAVLRGLYP